MTFKEAIGGLVEIECLCKRLRQKGFQSRWFILGVKGLEQHAAGLRFALEGIRDMTSRITKTPKVKRSKSATNEQS